MFGQAQSLYQPPPQLGSVVVAFQRKVNRSLEVPAGISKVVSRAAMHQGMHRMSLVDQQRDRVGQLNLPARSARDPSQRIEDRPIEHIATRGGIGRRRILGLGFFHHALDP